MTEDQIVADLPKRILPILIVVLILVASLAGCAELRNANSDPRDFFANKERWSGGGAP